MGAMASAYGVLCFAWVLREFLNINCYMHGFYALPTVLIVNCMGFIVLLIFGCVAWVLSAWVFIVLSIFDCVLIGCIGLLIFGCVLHGFYRFVDI